jgi:hypothetical protein
VWAHIDVVAREVGSRTPQARVSFYLSIHYQTAIGVISARGSYELSRYVLAAVRDLLRTRSDHARSCTQVHASHTLLWQKQE